MNAQNLRPYPAYLDSGVEWLGKIPEHWIAQRVKAALVRNESGVWGDDFDDDGTIVLRSTEQTIQGGWRIEDPARRRLTPREATSARLRAGDLVVTTSSGSASHIGKASLVDDTVAALNCCYSNFMQRLRISSEHEPAFFWYFMNSTVARRQLVFLSSTTTGLSNLNGSILGAIRLPVAPHEEQRAIVRFLNHADRRIRRAIRAKEKLIALLEEQKQALIHDAVTGRTDVRTGQPYPAYKPSGVSWLGKVPARWKIRAAKWDFLEADERSQTGTEELLSVSHLTGVTPRSQKNITMFKAESNVGYKQCRPGDIVVNTMWAWMAALGMARQAGIVSPSYAVYRPRSSSRLLGDYAELLLRTATYKAEYRRRSTGIRPSRLRLYPEEFLRLPLLTPSFREQEAIVGLTRDQRAIFARQVQSTTLAITRLKEYRARLIADVVTGKLDVREAAASLPEDDAPTASEEHAGL